ncbi:MAG: AAA family ATPase [Deltaproteobacteria bacterium]|nr:AAA family ATPase [Deltaproteobacteria bacterium]
MTVPLVIADRFLDAVGELPSADKGRVFDFMLRFRDNPAHPSISLERVTDARSSGVWSGRITVGLRAILYKDGDTWVAVHAGRHDAAYRWAETHDIGRHEATGELQIVEIPVTPAAPAEAPVARSAVGPAAAAPPGAAAHSATPLFADRQDAYLSSLGVPASWLPVVREVRSEDELLQVAGKLPQEVADRLLRLAMGELVTPPVPLPIASPIPAGAQPSLLVQPDLMTLEAALKAPLERWIGFLHPTQRQLVEAQPRGPMKVTGSAGTGKTTVALHRARHLARQGHRVLLTTFVTTLAHNLLRQLRVLCTPDELARITVSTVHARALAVCQDVDALVKPASDADVRQALEQARLGLAPTLDPRFVRTEYDAVVAPQGIGTWAEYRVARRTGRGKPLSVTERKTLWGVFERALAELESRRRLDWTGLCRFALRALDEVRVKSTFGAVLVDEVQDLRPVELRFLRALGGAAPERLALYGDAGQRLYTGGVTLSALGIDVRGRSHVLRLNYRTTEQIRRAADAILATGSSATDDLDGGAAPRTARSLHSGPTPALQGFDVAEAEREAAVRIVRAWIEGGVEASAIAIFARTNGRIGALGTALEGAGIAVHLLSDDDGQGGGGVRLGTMHRAKGLEFKAVLVHDASAATLPSPTALSSCEDPQDREDVLERERNLLYVAMTRARDRLAVTWTGAPSPFLGLLIARA